MNNAGTKGTAEPTMRALILLELILHRPYFPLRYDEYLCVDAIVRIPLIATHGM